MIVAFFTKRYPDTPKERLFYSNNWNIEYDPSKVMNSVFIFIKAKIGTKFSYAKFNVDKAQATATGGQVLETSLAVSPNVKLSFKANKGADLGIDYTSGNFYASEKKKLTGPLVEQSPIIPDL